MNMHPNDIKEIRIHPAIGIARLGNSEEFFVGPEYPGQRCYPAGGFKDKSGKIKRQAARFRLFAYDKAGRTEEITAADANITWYVHVANLKAIKRNPRYNPADMAIDPKEQIVDAREPEKKFNGKIRFTGRETKVSLGGVRMEQGGQLLVLGSQDNSDSPFTPKRWNGGEGQLDFLDNPGWYDTAADGPVSAKVEFKQGGKVFEPNVVKSAWVVIGPPKYAPDMDNIVTLYDKLFELAVDGGWCKPPTTTSYTQDIYPILQRAKMMRWVQKDTFGRHDWPHPLYEKDGKHTVNAYGIPIAERLFAMLRTPETLAEPVREEVAAFLNKLESKGVERPKAVKDRMPKLEALPEFSPTTLAKPQYLHMLEWAQGEFERDWKGEPVAVAIITPEGMNRAALENCVGAAFNPGIEVGGVIYKDPNDRSKGCDASFVPPILNKDNYDRDHKAPADFMRLNYQYGRQNNLLGPGLITRYMAVPWQADVLDCADIWWPAQRPNQVVTELSNDYVSWDRGASPHSRMVENWTRLGFIVKDEKGGEVRYVEKERDATLKG